MNIGFKHIGVTLLFIAGMGNAFANPGGRRDDSGHFARFFQLKRITVERGEQRNEARMAGADERRRSGEPDRYDNGDFGNQSGNSSSQVNDNARKQGRLSPEERRALRRQIDEAGHDIYRPKR